MSQVSVGEIENVKDRFQANGLVLDVICRTERKEDKGDTFWALVLSEPVHRALINEINRRRIELDNKTNEIIDFVPWWVLVNHPLARRDRSLKGATNRAGEAWEAYANQSHGNDANLVAVSSYIYIPASADQYSSPTSDDYAAAEDVVAVVDNG